ncbi:MAG: hypothetical protein PHN82_09565 [bacterium]|nr:hypothetical protein [bacterium]
MRRRLLAWLSLVLCITVLAGCTEMRMTMQAMNLALVELFRLPVYVMRIPFELIQGLGPAISAGIRSAANLAPLLLFIEDRPPDMDRLHASSGGCPASLAIRAAEDGAPAPLLDVLGAEIAARTGARFTLVDPRLLGHPAAREAILGGIGGGGGRVRCVFVDGSDLARDRGRFAAVCREMGERGHALFALTLFNDDLAALAGLPTGGGPPPADGHPITGTWRALLEGLGHDALPTERESG